VRLCKLVSKSQNLRPRLFSAVLLTVTTVVHQRFSKFVAPLIRLSPSHGEGRRLALWSAYDDGAGGTSRSRIQNGQRPDAARRGAVGVRHAGEELHHLAGGEGAEGVAALVGGRGRIGSRRCSPAPSTCFHSETGARAPSPALRVRPPKRSEPSIAHAPAKRLGGPRSGAMSECVPAHGIRKRRARSAAYLSCFFFRASPSLRR
jgi:hypothetical protein